MQYFLIFTSQTASELIRTKVSINSLPCQTVKLCYVHMEENHLYRLAGLRIITDISPHSFLDTAQHRQLRADCNRKVLVINCTPSPTHMASSFPFPLFHQAERTRPIAILHASPRFPSGRRAIKSLAILRTGGAMKPPAGLSTKKLLLPPCRCARITWL